MKISTLRIMSYLVFAAIGVLTVIQILKFNEERKDIKILIKSVKLKREKMSFINVPRLFNSSCWENPCEKPQDILWRMTFLVKSKGENHKIRDLIGETWASLRFVENVQLSTVFVTGRGNEYTQQIIDDEVDKHGDILQINVSDAYSHIGYKTLGGMQWAMENLQQNDFYTSCDDDMIIDIIGLVDSIKMNQMKKISQQNWPEFPIICTYAAMINSNPLRIVDSKYYTSLEEYKWPFWPDFCLGGAYTTSMHVVGLLWHASFKSDLVKMDDVWITGILRQMIGIPRQFIVKPEKTLALHYDGYRDLEIRNKRDFIVNQWDYITKSYKNIATCTCYT